MTKKSDGARASARRGRAAKAPAEVPAAGRFDGPALPMGRSGARHPPIGLGLWALGRWYPDDEERTRNVLQHALGRRIPWVDTAEVYGAGRSERILGDALARGADGASRPFLSTKVSWEHLRAAQVRAALIGSRHRLGVERIDLYLVHAPDPHVPIAETMAAMEAVWKEGHVSSIGVSNFSVEELEAARGALSEAEIAVNQVRFNLFEREDAEPVLEYCRQHRIVVEAYTPTARGLLAGRFLTGRGPAKSDPRHGRGIFDAERFPTYQKRALELDALAREAGVPMLSLALHYLTRVGAAPVFGASTAEQFDEVLDAWGRRPTDEVLDRADRIARGDGR
ncbi:MAG TPA: aldo/keto reductase [Thermoplasmata archaeon]|nr:aldo/keto reductase [Thermoplasmata archaeon]